MIPYATLSPSPFRSGPLVVKNGSIARRLTSSDIPIPESSTAQCTTPSACQVLTVISPPAGSASTAFVKRIYRTSRNAIG